MTCTMPPTDSVSKPRVREGTIKASGDAGVMWDEVTAWRGSGEQGLSLHSPQNHGDAVRCTGELRTNPQHRGAQGQDGDAHSSPAQQGSAWTTESCSGWDRRAGVLTQHHHPSLQGQMQAAASATLAFPEGEVKGLPGVPSAGRNRSPLAGSCLMERKSHKTPVGSSKFCHIGSHGPPDSNIWLMVCDCSKGMSGQASLFPPHSLRPPFHPKRAKVLINTCKTPALTWAGKPYLCSAGYWFSDIIFGMCTCG